MVCILKPEGGDKLMYFDKNLENIGLKIVKENGNWDDIKAEKDLQEIIRVINGIKSNINISLYIKEGIDLKERLKGEYLEIQQMYKIISNISSCLPLSSFNMHTIFVYFLHLIY